VPTSGGFGTTTSRSTGCALGGLLAAAASQSDRAAYWRAMVWRQLRREGIEVARCTVARLMRAMGLRGIVRGKTVRTTVSDRAAPCPLDRVNRDFEAPRPNALPRASC
jgi:transposase InsO family protein